MKKTFLIIALVIAASVNGIAQTKYITEVEAIHKVQDKWVEWTTYDTSSKTIKFQFANHQLASVTIDGSTTKVYKGVSNADTEIRHELEYLFWFMVDNMGIRYKVSLIKGYNAIEISNVNTLIVYNYH